MNEASCVRAGRNGDGDRGDSRWSVAVMLRVEKGVDGSTGREANSWGSGEREDSERRLGKGRGDVVWSASPLLREGLVYGNRRCGGACLVRKRGECGCARAEEEDEDGINGERALSGRREGLGRVGCDRRRKQIKKGSVRWPLFGGRVEEAVIKGGKWEAGMNETAIQDNMANNPLANTFMLGYWSSFFNGMPGVHSHGRAWALCPSQGCLHPNTTGLSCFSM
ncbi:hypothetical protein H0E87_026180 [Populus deltoides]|uniref:Uncharacterized protein n=1 Tax=Populus deltoides TaxID=3696 RepID=A0A8T2X5S5_POPDE|nr:hypothetical protein H0E87_026180 [Populus deltoides]